MITINTEIRARWLMARKNGEKNIAAMLGALIGDIENKMKEKNAKDSDTIALASVKTFVKNAKDTLHLVQDDDRYENDRKSLEEQITVLEGFLPSLMSEDEIREFFVEDDIKTLKDAMQRIKAERPGQYDGALASRVAKEMFA
jgi:uncharacterized protein YqeY